MIIEIRFCAFYMTVLLLTNSVDASTWTDVKNEYTKLYQAYLNPSGIDQFYTDVIPRSANTAPIDISIGIELYAMREFDAIDGALEIVGSVLLTWTDQIESLSTSTTFDSSKVSSLLVNYKKIWTPTIVLLNAASSIEKVGDDAYPVRLNLSTGAVLWKPRVIMRASCTPNVEFFPFDQQECEFDFMPWAQDSSNVRLVTGSDSWDVGGYKDSGIWKKDSTSSTVEIIDGFYHAKFTFKFSRQPLFFIINVVFPVLLLSVLSGFLFLLPVASGERVGFSITCFLSFVILLQTMVQYLPELSDPMSLLCYYAIIMMCFSGLLSLVNILLLKVYHKTDSDNIPKPMIHFLEVIKCIKCKRLRDSHDNKGSADSEGGVGRPSTDTNNSPTKELDWTAVGKLLDVFFLMLFIGAQIGFTLVFLVPIGAQA